MPMLDVYIPTGALAPDAERTLMDELTSILLRAEGADPSNAFARQISWAFLHRPEVFVASTLSPKSRTIGSSRGFPRASSTARPRSSSSLLRSPTPSCARRARTTRKPRTGSGCSRSRSPRATGVPSAASRAWPTYWVRPSATPTRAAASPSTASPRAARNAASPPPELPDLVLKTGREGPARHSDQLTARPAARNYLKAGRAVRPRDDAADLLPARSPGGDLARALEPFTALGVYGEGVSQYGMLALDGRTDRPAGGDCVDVARRRRRRFLGVRGRSDYPSLDRRDGGFVTPAHAAIRAGIVSHRVTCRLAWVDVGRLGRAVGRCGGSVSPCR